MSVARVQKHTDTPVMHVIRELRVQLGLSRRRVRVGMSMVLGQLAAGRTVDELLEDYPYLERADVT